MHEAATTCVIDTSALVAILAGEPEATSLVDALGYYPQRILPPSCVVELCSLRRLRVDMRAWLPAFIEEYNVAIVPMDAEIAWLAGKAAIRYGRGSQHPAGLNFGDCMSYAFARHFDAPLLFKGDDFAHTDMTPARALG